MRLLTAILALFISLVALPATGGNKPRAPRQVPQWADSLKSLYLYTEGVKALHIHRDTSRAVGLFNEALTTDPDYAPAHHALSMAVLSSRPAEARDHARRAYECDSTNLWYHRLYAQSLLVSGDYREALDIFVKLKNADAKNPDNYRILAALYELRKQPYAALSTLDSAEVRFGRIPLLSQMKRQLLLSTHQTDKAIEDARAIVEEAPYNAENQLILAGLYDMTHQDSLAAVHFKLAYEADSTSVRSLKTLYALADHYAVRRDFRRMLQMTQAIFESDEETLDNKIERFKLYTDDRNFYREYYFQLDGLARTLALKYPKEVEVVNLYANHLILSGELEHALELYKVHLADENAPEEYYISVINMENYLRHTDSVRHYVHESLRRHPSSMPLRMLKGNLYDREQQHDKAIAVYTEALSHAQTDTLKSQLWGIIADSWFQISCKGLPDEGLRVMKNIRPRDSRHRKAVAQADKAYGKALKYQPDNVLLMNNYAYFMAVEGIRLPYAEELAQRVIEATGRSNATYLDTYAWVLYRQGRLDEARKIMRQAIVLDKDNSPSLLVHLGDITNALGDRFIAETYWRKALEAGYDAQSIADRFPPADDKQ